MEPRIDHLISRGRQAFERRDYVAALADFREVLEQQPAFADIRHLAGLCLNFLGQPEEALREFDRALELNEGYVEAHLNRAITLNELGRYDEAREAFDRAGRFEREGDGPYPAAVSARLANAHAELGDLYMAASAPEEAAAQYRAALELRPRFLDIRNKLAHALIQMGDLDGAESELRRALEANPHFMAARLNLGLVHYRRGELDEATGEWGRCRAQEPEHPQVRAYLAMLERPAVPYDASGGPAGAAPEAGTPGMVDGAAPATEDE
ncbi:MAG TPA: tetratricopeptide repeat protein [Longimicrobiales bacterium]